MNIKKNDRLLLTPLAGHVLHSGLFLIYLSLFRLLFEVQNAAPFPESRAVYFGRLLEYPVAALALLTAAVFLLDRAVRHES